MHLFVNGHVIPCTVSNVISPVFGALETCVDGTNLSGSTLAIWKKTWRRPMKLGSISFHRVDGDQKGLG